MMKEQSKWRIMKGWSRIKGYERSDQERKNDERSDQGQKKDERSLNDDESKRVIKD